MLKKLRDRYVIIGLVILIAADHHDISGVFTAVGGDGTGVSIGKQDDPDADPQGLPRHHL